MKSLFVVAVIIACISGIYVSPNGSDTAGCGTTNITACRSIAFAKNISTELVLLTGNYTESQAVIVGAGQTLTITGVNRTGCILSKSNNSISLFTVDEANANLTILNLTVLLTNHSETFTFVSADSSVIVSVNFGSCRFMMQTGITQIYGHSIYISNSNAKLSLINCTAFNISSTNTPFIYTPRINTLFLKDSSFVNINNTNTNASGGCFYTEATTNLSLTRCTFTSCSSGNSGGVGYVYRLIASGSLIDTCTFANSTAPNFGVLHILGDDTAPSINIFNTTASDCSASNGGGGAFSLYNHLTPNVSWCTFTGCTSNGTNGSIGAALYIHVHTIATVDRCTFLRCGARYGSAIYVYDMSSVIISNSILMTNTVSGGTHIYANNSANVTIDNNTYSDGNPAVSNDSTSIVTGSVQNRTIYNTITCTVAFGAPAPIDGYCAMPCAAFNNTCVKPDACPADRVSTTGLCVPQCSYWKPWTVGTALTCSALCTTDTQKGYPLCVTACERRLRNISALFPCGSENCYYDPAAPAQEGLQCLTTCVANAHHIGEGVEGVCTLKDCTQRTRNVTAAHICGGSDCFYDAAGQTQCRTTCALDGFHTGVVEAEECVLKACEDRTADPTSAPNGLPCGTNNCLYDENMTAQAGKSCVGACATAHYRAEASNASCVLKTCPTRLRNETATLPCATADCFYDPYARPLAGQQCVLACPQDNLHTGAGVNGVCTMTACQDRVRNASAIHPCGSDDCYYDSAGSVAEHTQCTSTCVEDTLHSGIVENDECLLKTCEQRLADPAATQPCGGIGGNCYFDPTAPAVASLQCLLNCTNNHQLSGSIDRDTMTCLLKPCPQRLQNASTIFPCGTADCFYDTHAEPVVGQQCGLACDVSGYQPDLTTGICVVIPPPPEPEPEVEEDPAAVKARKQAKAGVALGIVALVLAIVALAGVVFLFIYCYFCSGKAVKAGYEAVNS